MRGAKASVAFAAVFQVLIFIRMATAEDTVVVTSNTVATTITDVQVSYAWECDFSFFAEFYGFTELAYTPEPNWMYDLLRLQPITLSTATNITGFGMRCNTEGDSPTNVTFALYGSTGGEPTTPVVGPEDFYLPCGQDGWNVLHTSQEYTVESGDYYVAQLFTGGYWQFGVTVADTPNTDHYQYAYNYAAGLPDTSPSLDTFTRVTACALPITIVTPSTCGNITYVNETNTTTYNTTNITTIIGTMSVEMSLLVDAEPSTSEMSAIGKEIARRLGIYSDQVVVTVAAVKSYEISIIITGLSEGGSEAATEMLDTTEDLTSIVEAVGVSSFVVESISRVPSAVDTVITINYYSSDHFDNCTVGTNRSGWYVHFASDEVETILPPTCQTSNATEGLYTAFICSDDGTSIRIKTWMGENENACWESEPLSKHMTHGTVEFTSPHVMGDTAFSCVQRSFHEVGYFIQEREIDSTEPTLAWKELSSEDVRSEYSCSDSGWSGSSTYAGDVCAADPSCTAVIEMGCDHIGDDGSDVGYWRTCTGTLPDDIECTDDACSSSTVTAGSNCLLVPWTTYYEDTITTRTTLPGVCSSDADLNLTLTCDTDALGYVYTATYNSDTCGGCAPDFMQWFRSNTSFDNQTLLCTAACNLQFLPYDDGECPVYFGCLESPEPYVDMSELCDTEDTGATYYARTTVAGETPQTRAPVCDPYSSTVLACSDTGDMVRIFEFESEGCVGELVQMQQFMSGADPSVYGADYSKVECVLMDFEIPDYFVRRELFSDGSGTCTTNIEEAGMLVATENVCVPDFPGDGGSSVFTCLDTYNAGTVVQEVVAYLWGNSTTAPLENSSNTECAGNGTYSTDASIGWEWVSGDCSSGEMYTCVSKLDLKFVSFDGDVFSPPNTTSNWSAYYPTARNGETAVVHLPTCNMVDPTGDDASLGNWTATVCAGDGLSMVTKYYIGANDHACVDSMAVAVVEFASLPIEDEDGVTIDCIKYENHPGYYIKYKAVDNATDNLGSYLYPSMCTTPWDDEDSATEYAVYTCDANLEVAYASYFSEFDTCSSGGRCAPYVEYHPRRSSSGIINGNLCTQPVVASGALCIPGIDDEGIVCANDGNATEAYCSYDLGADVCAYCNDTYFAPTCVSACDVPLVPYDDDGGAVYDGCAAHCPDHTTCRSEEEPVAIVDALCDDMVLEDTGNTFYIERSTAEGDSNAYAPRCDSNNPQVLVCNSEGTAIRMYEFEEVECRGEIISAVQIRSDAMSEPDLYGMDGITNLACIEMSGHPDHFLDVKIFTDADCADGTALISQTIPTVSYCMSDFASTNASATFDCSWYGTEVSATLYENSANETDTCSGTGVDGWESTSGECNGEHYMFTCVLTDEIIFVDFDGVPYYGDTNRSATPSATVTTSSTMSTSMTLSATVTASMSSSPSETASESSSMTYTPSFSSSGSSSATSSKSSSATYSMSSSATASLTASLSLGASPSATRSDTPTMSGTPSTSASSSESQSQTPSHTPSPSPICDYVSPTHADDTIDDWAVSGSICAYNEWGDEVIPGRVYVPFGDGPFPVLTVLHGSDGLYVDGDRTQDINSAMREFRTLCYNQSYVCIFPDSYAFRYWDPNPDLDTRAKDAFATIPFLYSNTTLNANVDEMFVIGPEGEGAEVALNAISTLIEPFSCEDDDFLYTVVTEATETDDAYSTTYYCDDEGTDAAWVGTAGLRAGEACCSLGGGKNISKYRFRGGVVYFPNCSDVRGWNPYNPAMISHVDTRTDLSQTCCSSCGLRVTAAQDMHGSKVLSDGGDFVQLSTYNMTQPFDAFTEAEVKTDLFAFVAAVRYTENITAGAYGFTYGTRSSSATYSSSVTASYSQTMAPSNSSSMTASMTYSATSSATYSASASASASMTASASYGDFDIEFKVSLAGATRETFDYWAQVAFINATAELSGVAEEDIYIEDVEEYYSDKKKKQNLAHGRGHMQNKQTVSGIDVTSVLQVRQSDDMELTNVIPSIINDPIQLGTYLQLAYTARNITWDITGLTTEVYNTSVRESTTASLSPSPSPRCSTAVCPYRSERMVNQKALHDEMFIDYDPAMPPMSDLGPRSIGISMTIFSVKTVRLARGNLELRVWLNLHWLDERLAWNTTIHNVTDVKLARDASSIWTPDIQVMHQEDAFSGEWMQQQRPIVDSSGYVRWSRPGIINSDCSFEDLETYPWDHPKCTFQLGSWRHTSGELMLTTLDPPWYMGGLDSNDEPGKTRKEYSVQRIMATDGRTMSSGMRDDWVVLQYTVVLARTTPMLFLVRTLIPNMFLTSVSFLSFYLNPECHERVSMGLFCVLAQYLAKLLFASRTEFTSIWTAFDRINVALLYISMIVFFESVLVTGLYYKAQIVGTRSGSLESQLKDDAASSSSEEEGEVGDNLAAKTAMRLKKGAGGIKTQLWYLLEIFLKPPKSNAHDLNSLRIKQNIGSKKRAKLVMDEKGEQNPEQREKIRHKLRVDTHQRTKLSYRIKEMRFLADYETDQLRADEHRYRLMASRIDLFARMLFPAAYLGTLFAFLAEIFKSINLVDERNVYEENEMGWVQGPASTIQSVGSMFVAVVLAVAMQYS